MTHVPALEPRRRRPLVRLVASLAIAGAIFLGMLMLLESSLIYFPTAYPDGFWDTAAVGAEGGCTVEDCFFPTADGHRLHAWWCRPGAWSEPDPASTMVLLWFHGNAGNLSHRAGMMLKLQSLPVQVFLVDYRGYGRSQGKPSESGLYQDGRAAWRYLTETRGVTPSHVIVFGKSLGGAVAVDLATEVGPAGLIVQSSFTSIREMARHHYPFVPGALIRTRMDSLAKISRVRCPKLFIHSPADEIVPFELGQRLFEAAPEPKRLHVVPGASHNETDVVGGAAYLAALRDFVHDCAEPGLSPARLSSS